MFVVLTGNSATYAVGGLLVVLGVIGALLLVVKLLKDHTDREVGRLSERQASLLREYRSGVVEIILHDRHRFSAIDFSSFFKEFEDYFVACQDFSKDSGAHYESATQETLIFSQDIFDEYGRCFSEAYSLKMASLIRESIEAQLHLIELNMELARLDEREAGSEKPSRLSQYQ